MIRFTTTLDQNGVVTLPKNSSDQLPTRGMTIVEGVLDDTKFRVPLEPDGEGSHWFLLGKKLEQIVDNKTVSIELAPTKNWPEPTIPNNVKQALAADPQAKAQWEDITTMARWDWLRWMESVKQEQTRNERPAKLCSMLKSGKRRPCCFNRALHMPPRAAEIL